MIIIYWFSSYLFYYFNEKTFPTFFSLLYELAVSSAFAQTQNSPALTDTIEKNISPMLLHVKMSKRKAKYY
jgi:hypothetical protein